MIARRPGPLPPLLQRFVFSWETMHTIISGRSAIDLSHLRMAGTGRQDAHDFLQRYGYDLDVASHQADVEGIRVEALGFVRGVLAHGLDGVHVPELFDTMLILDLLLLAAGQGRPGDTETVESRREFDLNMAWACAILRVMHTIAHAVNYFQDNYYREIRARILDRFVQQVRTAEDGSQYLHAKSFDVPLRRFEVKETKPLRSVVLKLLQKQENVAYDLFDHIGVRIIVDKPVDALFAVRALREEHTIMYPNIKPTRSRNTLLDLGAYDAHVRDCLLRYQSGELSELQTVEAVHSFVQQPSGTAQVEWNPYSSDKYNSIQFTCRQMIRFENPLFQRMNDAQVVARKHLQGDALAEMLATLSTAGIDPEIQFFFPYEVQVMDITSYEAATSGRAAYAEYKSRQVVSARQRVMPKVLELLNVPAIAPANNGGRTPSARRPFAPTGILPMATVEELQSLIASRELS